MFLDRIVSICLLIMLTCNSNLQSEYKDNGLYIKSVERIPYEDIIKGYCEQIEIGETVDLQLYIDICYYYNFMEQYDKALIYSSKGIQEIGWSDEYTYDDTRQDFEIGTLLFEHAYALEQYTENYEEALKYFFASLDCLQNIEKNIINQYHNDEKITSSRFQLYYNEFVTGCHIYNTLLLNDDIKRAITYRDMLLSDEKYSAIYQSVQNGTLKTDNEYDINFARSLAEVYETLLNDSIME